MAHQHDGGCCAQSVVSVHQTMDEMEFERGLWYAALHNDTARVKQLLSAGKDPNAQDTSGYAPMHYACRAGHTDTCRLLLDAGACVNSRTRAGGATCLHRAAIGGHREVIELLLARGADITLQDEDLQTALHKAAANGNQGVLELLVDRSPGLCQIRDRRGRLAMDVIPAHQKHLLQIFHGR